MVYWSTEPVRWSADSVVISWPAVHWHPAKSFHPVSESESPRQEAAPRGGHKHPPAAALLSSRGRKDDKLPSSGGAGGPLTPPVFRSLPSCGPLAGEG